MEAVTAGLMLIAIFAALTQLWRYMYGSRLDLPGPSILQALTKIRISNMHFQVDEWKQKYGDIFQVPFPRVNMVMVNGYDSIREVLVTKADVFADKSGTFTRKILSENFRGAFNGPADRKFRILKKKSGVNLKQHGDGKDGVEDVFTNQAECLFKYMESHHGEAVDPFGIMCSIIIRTMSAFVLSEPLPENMPWEANMLKYEHLLFDTLQDPHGFVHNIVPVHYIYETKLMKTMKRVVSVLDEIWCGLVKPDVSVSHGNSLIRDLLKENKNYDDIDVKHTIGLILVGIATASNSLYALINILIHKKDVKTKLEEEITQIVGCSRAPTLQDRPHMPYTRAVMFELSRYHSMVPHLSPRTAGADVSIHGRAIPAGTQLTLNLWGMHHDEKFWGDPWEFRPERFLSESGDELVPADHPNRRHLMPFSAGPRVCCGETMALSHLFIWIVTIIQRFDLQPGEVDVPYDVRTYSMAGVLRQPLYTAQFVSRI